MKLSIFTLGAATLVMVVLACSPPPPIRTPTQAPAVIVATADPTPAQNSAEAFGVERSEIEIAFVDDAEEMLDAALYLAGATCEGLAELKAEDREVFIRMRGYADVLKRMSARDQALSRPEIQGLVEDLDEAMTSLSMQLQSCGIA